MSAPDTGKLVALLRELGPQLETAAFFGLDARWTYERVADWLVARGVGLREAEPPPAHNFAALREAAVRANRELDGIRLRVLEKYPSGRGDLSPIGSRSYEVRSFMSAVIRATEDLRRETGMYDGCPNIMPPPAKNEGRGVEPPPPGPWRAEEIFGSFTHPPRELGWVVARGKPGEKNHFVTMTPGGEAEAIAVRDALNRVAASSGNAVRGEAPE